VSTQVLTTIQRKYQCGRRFLAAMRGLGLAQKGLFGVRRLTRLASTVVCGPALSCSSRRRGVRAQPIIDMPWPYRCVLKLFYAFEDRLHVSSESLQTRATPGLLAPKRPASCHPRGLPVIRMGEVKPDEPKRDSFHGRLSGSSARESDAQALVARCFSAGARCV